MKPEVSLWYPYDNGTHRTAFEKFLNGASSFRQAVSLRQANGTEFVLLGNSLYNIPIYEQGGRPSC